MKNSEERTAWIAMDRLCPVPFQNYMIRTGSEDIKLRAVNSELGIFGAIIGYGTIQRKNKNENRLLFFLFFFCFSKKKKKKKKKTKNSVSYQKKGGRATPSFWYDTNF